MCCLESPWALGCYFWFTCVILVVLVLSLDAAFHGYFYFRPILLTPLMFLLCFHLPSSLGFYSFSSSTELLAVSPSRPLTWQVTQHLTQSLQTHGKPTGFLNICLYHKNKNSLGMQNCRHYSFSMCLRFCAVPQGRGDNNFSLPEGTLSLI
jgi:hypothetical protein